MGHAIHKHMSSGQRYDDKQAYNKKLSSKARLHYLENEEHDKGVSRYEDKGMSRYEDKGMSRYEDKGMSRQASPLNDFKGGYHKVQHAKGEAHKGTSRKSSPANNYVDPAEAVMAGAKDTREGAGGMSRSCKYKK